MEQPNEKPLCVDPRDIFLQQQAGWPDWDPEDYCWDCGVRNPSWTAPWVAWSAVMGTEPETVLCPYCFAARYEEWTGHKWIFNFIPHRRILEDVSNEDSNR